MKPKALILTIMAFALSLSACNAGKSTTPALTLTLVQTPAAVDSGFNLLVVVKGEVQLKRGEWKDYHSTAFGAVLHRGDLLRPASSAEVVVLCDNLTTWNVPAGIPSGLTNGCPQPPEPVLMSGNSLLPNTRGGNDPLIPYIISPRATKLLSETPTLRWNPSPGSTRYSVQIKGEVLIWESDVSATQTIYPGKPPLEPGRTYLLIVEADNGKSSQDEDIPGLGFSLLNESDAQEVQDDAEHFAELNLPDKAKAYALAQLYAGDGLMAEAIETLEALVGADSQTAAVYRALGDFYLKIGLSLLAGPHYRRAIELAEVAGDVEGSAEAQAGLGTVYETQGNKDEATRWLDQARAGFEVLGDMKRVSEIEKQLNDLSP